MDPQILPIINIIVKQTIALISVFQSINHLIV